jgi:hypothetical protein
MIREQVTDLSTKITSTLTFEEQWYIMACLQHNLGLWSPASQAQGGINDPHSDYTHMRYVIDTLRDMPLIEEQRNMYPTIDGDSAYRNNVINMVNAASDVFSTNRSARMTRLAEFLSQRVQGTSIQVTALGSMTSPSREISAAVPQQDVW